MGWSRDISRNILRERGLNYVADPTIFCMFER